MVRPGGAAAFLTSPFTKLARTHALMAAGDALVALALAGSLFFNIEPDAARWRVALYLVLTVAPFSVVAPLIGPAIDRARGGRRIMVVTSAVGRSVIAMIMTRHVNSLLLFPEAFLMLVLSKGYAVSKAALVPTLVNDESALVEANSKLTLVSGLMGFLAVLPGLPLMHFGGAQWVLGLASLVFAGSAVAAVQLPRSQVAAEPAGPEERAELRSAGVLVAASAMALLRAMVGFLTFLIAFFLRNDHAPTWWFGVALVASGAGAVIGALVAPPIRRFWPEERILILVLLAVMVAGFLAANGAGRAESALVAAVVGLAASAGKLAFDSIVQRDAPDANQGRSFARFETRFQLGWVIGGLLPVVVPIPVQLGYLILALTAGFAGFSYLAGLRSVRLHGRPPEPLRERVSRNLPRIASALAGDPSEEAEEPAPGTVVLEDGTVLPLPPMLPPPEPAERYDIAPEPTETMAVPLVPAGTVAPAAVPIAHAAPRATPPVVALEGIARDEPETVESKVVEGDAAAAVAPEPNVPEPNGDDPGTLPLEWPDSE